MLRVVRYGSQVTVYVGSSESEGMWLDLATALGVVGDYDVRFPLNAEGNYWIAGEPEECGWYLAAYGKKGAKIVTQLWYNPQSREKWWEGAPGKTWPFVHKVTHYRRMPAPPEGGW